MSSKLEYFLQKILSIQSISLTKFNISQMTSFKKHYCCLHHYLSGKNQKANTPCYSHVPLGVINPIHQITKMQQKQKNPNFQITAQKWTLKSHTHFYNDIKNKQSLPKRLAQPRVYVGQVYSKGRTELQQKFRPPVQKRTYEEIADMFEKFAHVSNCHTFQSLHRKVISYMESRGIPRDISNENLLVLSYQFQDFLTESGMTSEDASKFYQIAFRENLFSKTMRSQGNLPQQRNDCISLKAFIFNFKKFYVDLKSYKRMFSNSGLKQRMIDLRLHLQPWHDRNIILKSSMQRHRIVQFQILQALKRQDEQLYGQFLQILEKRNSQWMFLRTISKAFYAITDGKGFAKQQIQDIVSNQIQRKSQQLKLFTQFAQKFLQTKQSSDDPEADFKATELIQFLREQNQKRQQSQTRVIIKWIRGVFKYVFFFKQFFTNQGQVTLKINKRTLNLDCLNGILQISSQTLTEFIQYKRKIIEDSIRILNSVLNRVQIAVQGMPHLETHSKDVVEKNYVVETVLRAVKEVQSYKDFYILWSIVYEFQDNVDGKVKEIVQKYVRDPCEVPSNFKKTLFSFQTEREIQAIEDLKIDKIALALQKYQQTKNSFPELKRYKGAQGKTKSKPKSSQQKKHKQNSSEQESERVQQKEKTQTINISYKSERHACSSGYCKICGQITETDISGTIESVEQMQSRIFSLLGV